ncbi:hypothetical protein KP509_27G061500 [Ceratopteris richardii]|uniref:SH3 domain-containing protein n=1 Tax=Ceratopteris richardii TaxID=49495 RepID=A0A8T2RIN6_CERRI|nr:hypothetical protein KP509_27G061500 [Ceratopteris richardii]
MQAVARQFSSHGYSASDTIVTDAAELQRHQQLEKLYNSTRAGKHYQRDIVKGVEGVVLNGNRQVEVVNKLCEEVTKYASESLGGQEVLGKSLLCYGKHRARVEREREILFNTFTTQVVEPLKAMVNGSPLEDARHLAQRYDRMRQDVEVQNSEVGKRQARLRESGAGGENALKLQIAEAKLQELTSSMAVLGKEATAALSAVETQQQRLTLHRLITLVDNERLYHQRAAEILDEIQAQIISERQKNDSLPPTKPKISVIDKGTKPSMESANQNAEVDLSNSFEAFAVSKNNKDCNVYLAEVMHGFEAEAEGELSLSAGDFVVVRQVLQTGWSEGECKGRAGWFPSAYVEYQHQVPVSKLSDTFT